MQKSPVDTQPVTNRRVVLAARPDGPATPDCFRLETAPVPPLGEGQLLLRTVYLSLDPYMRGRMSDAPSYAAPVAVGDVMVGGAVARVEASRDARFAPGDWVVAYSGWQEFAVVDAASARRLPDTIPRPSYALGVLGMPGFTAYAGLLAIGEPKPGETVCVAAATGAVGSVVGQIAKLKGCRAVGIAGGADKCEWAVRELGLDACIDHRAADFPTALAEACPRGIDVYFENVGGAVLRAVVPLLNPRARVPVCGLIAHYDSRPPAAGNDWTAALLRAVLVKRLTVRGFIIFEDFAALQPEFEREMSRWLGEGRIRYREHVVEGLENAPQALLGLLEGRNFGKTLVAVSADPSRR